MSLKKRVSKSIALALVGVTVMTSMLSSISAMENQHPNIVENIDSVNSGVITE